jgi:hypothetical protein
MADRRIPQTSLKKKRGSMMAPASSGDADLASARRRLADTMLPDFSQSGQLPLPFAALARAWSFQRALGHALGTQWSGAIQFGAALTPSGLKDSTLRGGPALGQAMAERGAGLMALWWNGLAEVGTEAAEIGEANTLTKYAEQEMNILQQSLSLVAAQWIAAAREAENIQVDLACWLGVG